MSAENTVPGSVQREPPLEALLRVGPRLVERSRRQAEFAAALVLGLHRLGRRDGPRPAEPAAAAEAEPVTRSEPTVLDRVPPPTAPVTPAPPAAVTSAPAEQELPIEGYDSLAASQVVPRLTTLSLEELRSVQHYERSGRHRQTILNRVEQLLDGR